MKQIFTFFFVLLCVAGMKLEAQELSVKWEELNAVEFRDAVANSGKTAILPMGVLEKHGPHMPLGTDVYTAREIALRAAEQEYAVVFPWYYFGQIHEAKQQPGTVAYSPELLWMMLQETLDEISRNGFDKIILISGHGGNRAFLEYFCQSQLAEERDYALYWYQHGNSRKAITEAEAVSMHDPLDSHAGNKETSIVKAIVPDLVKPEIANTQPGHDMDRISNLDKVYTGIWWYASHPNHYAGDGSKANIQAGNILLDDLVGQFVEGLRKIKADKNVPALQEQFFKDAANPLGTKQPY